MNNTQPHQPAFAKLLEELSKACLIAEEVNCLAEQLESALLGTGSSDGNPEPPKIPVHNDSLANCLFIASGRLHGALGQTLASLERIAVEVPGAKRDRLAPAVRGSAGPSSLDAKYEMSRSNWDEGR